MKLSEAEWKIMNAVWERHPASARDVVERLEGRATWAYTTVKTMLARLTDKGALKSRLRANTTLYEPVLTRENARRSALRAVLDNAFSGAFGPMLHFLVSEEKLTKAQREELMRTLGETPARGAAGGKKRTE
jgi:BlaI family penicillinase repressor